MGFPPQKYLDQSGSAAATTGGWIPVFADDIAEVGFHIEWDSTYASTLHVDITDDPRWDPNDGDTSNCDFKEITALVRPINPTSGGGEQEFSVPVRGHAAIRLRTTGVSGSGGFEVYYSGTRAASTGLGSAAEARERLMKPPTEGDGLGVSVSTTTATLTISTLLGRTVVLQASGCDCYYFFCDDSGTADDTATSGDTFCAYLPAGATSDPFFLAPDLEDNGATAITSIEVITDAGAGMLRVWPVDYKDVASGA